MVVTLPPNLILGTYSNRFNSGFVASGPAAQGFFGHLFCGRSKPLVIDGSGSGYLNPTPASSFWKFPCANIKTWPTHRVAQRL